MNDHFYFFFLAGHLLAQLLTQAPKTFTENEGHTSMQTSREPPGHLELSAGEVTRLAVGNWPDELVCCCCTGCCVCCCWGLCAGLSEVIFF